LSRSNSSKNVSDVEVGSATVKADSMASGLETTKNDTTTTVDSLKSPELELDDAILGPDFFTLDERSDPSAAYKGKSNDSINY